MSSTRQCASLNDLLLWREEHGPDRLAFTFLRDGSDDEVNWTYRDLGRKARGIAAALQSVGSANKRALLLYPPSLDFIAAFWGCLFAGAVAVPVYPPRSNHNFLRLKTILKDARPSFVLTSQAALRRMQPFIRDDAQFSKLCFIATDALEEGLADGCANLNISQDAVAFLQYTSGSTDNPKGVIVTHSNVLENQAQIQEAFQQNETSMIAGWLPLYHDMGLVGNVVQPLYLGARCVLMPHLAFLQRPLRWLQMISRYRATASGGPDFAYDLCARRVSDEEAALLDLSSWRVAFNGAEPVRAGTLQRFAMKFKSAGFNLSAFCPCYGLAEATLLVSGHSDDEPPAVLNLDPKSFQQNQVRQSSDDASARAIVSSGRLARRNNIAIVDPQSLRECSTGQIGEVWVSGPSVAQGYWNRDEESSSIFRAHIPGRNAAYLRTGDLGFISGQELFITGRLKDLIIIRGRNHYPQDLEATVEAVHPALRTGCGAAFSVEAATGEEQLVIVYEIDRGQEKRTQGVLDAIREALVEQHETQPCAVVLVRPGSIPKTSSGKIQRHACRNSFLNGTLPAVAEWHSDSRDANSIATPAEKPSTLEDIQSWLTHKIVAATGIGRDLIDLNHALAGYIMDSFIAVELSYAIEAELGIAIPLSSLLSMKSGRQLAEELFANRNMSSAEQYQERENALETGPQEFPLSSGQKSLWFLHELAPGSVAYNLSFAARIPIAINVGVLRETLEMLIQRHSALRTSFHSAQSQLFQRVHNSNEHFFHEVDASVWTQTDIEARLQQEFDFHFDLEQAPPFRATLFYRAPAEYIIAFVVHHIIADLWSLAVLVRELMLVYAAKINARSLLLPDLNVRYFDFVSWERQLLLSPAGEELFAYWKNQLAGDLPVLALPPDRPRPPVQTYRGASKSLRLNAELSKKIEDIARANGCTSYMVLLAAFQVLLFRYCNQEEILVGSPTAGRSKREWAGVFGYFVNPLVMRSRLASEMGFVGLLVEVRETVLQALDHQSYPFSVLVERLHPERQPGYSPIFQTMFTFQKVFSQEEEIFAFALGEPDGRLELQGLVFESMASENRGGLFDLMLVMAERQERFSGFFQYNADLFDPETIERMVGHWENMLDQITGNPVTAIAEIALLGAVERRQVLLEWNATGTEYGPFVSVPELFEAQVQRTPSAIAAQFEQEFLTYAELNNRANRLARYLAKYIRKLGSGLEVPVGVCMERSLDLVIALLGILKIGAAYVPLEPDYPAERLEYMVSSAQAPVTISHESTGDKLSSYSGRIFTLDIEWPLIMAGSSENLGIKVEPENLVYVIFTSGSTGRPKGAMNTHAGLRNRLLWMQETFKLDAGDSVLQKTPFGFDVSVWEFFWPLIVGARLVVAGPGGHQDPAYLGRAIEEFGITTLHFVPSMLRVFLEAGEGVQSKSLRRILCSGETLSSELAQWCLESIPTELHNLYGPTETSIDVTHWKCETEAIRKSVPIGRPIANTQVYVLDSNMEPQPVNIPGELYLGGAGLARGYANAPHLTAERFVPNPFAISGERLYRTGDLVRYKPDGNLEFLGRRDAQIKLRGNRIELGEIECALRQFEAANDAVVILDNSLKPQIIAYIIARVQITAAELREKLRLQLPEYMIPSHFVLLEKLPLSPNGKVDRKALLLSSRERADHYIPPRNDIEEKLSTIWMEVLRLNRAGIEDNFFELGGDSILATQMVIRIKEVLHVEVPLQRVFQSPTISALAEIIKTMVAEYQAAGQVAVELQIKKLPRKSVAIPRE